MGRGICEKTICGDDIVCSCSFITCTGEMELEILGVGCRGEADKHPGDSQENRRRRPGLKKETSSHSGLLSFKMNARPECSGGPWLGSRTERRREWEHRKLG